MSKLLGKNCFSLFVQNLDASSQRTEVTRQKGRLFKTIEIGERLNSTLLKQNTQGVPGEPSKTFEGGVNTRDSVSCSTISSAHHSWMDTEITSEGLFYYT